MATLRLIAALAAASALSVAALLVEIHETGSSFYRFLVWNLFLAWVPLGAALACHALARRRAYAIAVGAGVIWLLFFPNAPYMLTDYIHIGEAPSPAQRPSPPTRAPPRPATVEAASPADYEEPQGPLCDLPAI